MNKYSIEITEPAENDLIGIRDYISNELLEPSIAKKIVSRIGNAILELEGMPQRHGLVADGRLALQGVRRIIVDNYIVFYIISEEDKTVTVIRILYSRRNWQSLI